VLAVLGSCLFDKAARRAVGHIRRPKRYPPAKVSKIGAMTIAA